MLGASFGQQYILQTGLKVFGKEGRDAASKEIDQLHQRSCFQPIEVASLTKEERRKAQDAIMFLTEKGTNLLRAEWSTTANQLKNGCQERTQRVRQHHTKAQY